MVINSHDVTQQSIAAQNDCFVCAFVDINIVSGNDIGRDRFFYPHQTAVKDFFSCTSFLFSLLLIIFNKEKMYWTILKGLYFAVAVTQIPLITPELSQHRFLRRGSSESVQIRLFHRCLISRLIFRCCDSDFHIFMETTRC